MRRIEVPVRFEGVVPVGVPENIDETVARMLAEKIALASILATNNNPDAPMYDAADDLAVECNLSEDEAGELFDRCRIQEPAGTWYIPPV